MVSRKSFLIAIAVTGVVAGVYHSSTSSRHPVTVEKLAVHDPNQLWAIDRSPTTGDWMRRYRFRREIAATTPEKPILKFDLRGTLELVRQGAWVQARFHLDRGRDHAAIESRVPFYFSMNGAGEITEIRSSGDADQQSILKDLALIFAYRTRLDTAGEVEIKLTESGDGDVAEIFKEKVQYAGQIGKLVRIKKSEHRIRKDLSLLAGVEITEMGRIETLSRYQLKLEKVDYLSQTKINPDLVAQFPVLPLLAGETGVAAAGADERPVVSWKALKLQLARIGKSRSSQRMKLFHEFIRTLRQDPSALGEFKDWMSSRRRAGEAGHRDFVFGLGVLGGVGTPAAQTELVAFHRAHADPAILNTLGTMQAPMTYETREFLKRLTTSMVDSECVPALFALGSGLRPRDGVVDDESVISLILARYEAARLVSERMEVLDAMGNSGNPRFLPTLSAVIHDPKSPQLLVTKAIFAMRLMKSTEARSLLSHLAGDSRYASYQGVILSALQHLPSRGML